MNRRGFLSLAAAAPVALILPELLVRKRSIFLPPRGGWPMWPWLPVPETLRYGNCGWGSGRRGTGSFAVHGHHVFPEIGHFLDFSDGRRGLIVGITYDDYTHITEFSFDYV